MRTNYSCSVDLGDKVRDTITGYTGVVIGITFWLNGCARIMIQGDRLKDGLPTESQCIDEVQLKVLKPRKVARGPSEPGGPIPRPTREPKPTR